MDAGQVSPVDGGEEVLSLQVPSQKLRMAQKIKNRNGNLLGRSVGSSVAEAGVAVHLPGWAGLTVPRDS